MGWAPMGFWKQKHAATDDQTGPNEILHPERVTSKEYYSALLGIDFGDDLAAAEHYLADGWREGVVPHPFVDRPMVRASMDAAVTLRDELRAFASSTQARPALGALGGIWEASAKEERGRGLRPVDAAAFLAGTPEERDALPVRGGATWGELRRILAASTRVVPRMQEARMFDLEHYSSLTGRTFLGWRAALDDYIVRGEREGATPNWAFEPEWFAAHDRSQTRGSRAFNQLFQYVSSDERLSTTPADRTGRTLAELLRSHDDAVLETFGGGATDIRSAKAAAAASVPRLPAVTQGRRVPLRGGTSLDVAVIVDARHLVSESHYEDLRTLARTQDPATRAVFVVCDADDGHEPPLSTLFEEERFHVLDAELGEPLGAVAARIVDEGGFSAWSLWRPGQQWKPAGLSDASRALDANPDSSGVGAYTPQAPQQWGELEGALWRTRLDAAGIVFRTDRIAPDPDRDYGLNADAVARLAKAGDGIVIEGDRFWARRYDGGVFANRAGANSARKSHVPAVDCSLPESTDTTVVVPTFEDWRMTVDAVAAVRDQRDAAVIVVDNGSRRAVGAILRQAFLGDEHVQYVRLPVNTDFAVASDFGARIAKSRNVVFLNNDTVVQEGWLRPLEHALADAVAVQPLLLFADRTVQTAGTVFAGGLSSPRHLLSGFHREDVPREVGEYSFSALTAACLAVSREDYLDTGGFDAEYVNGMEDVDLCLRLRNSTGRPLRVVPESTVVHLESKTEGRFAHVVPNRRRFSQVWRDELLGELDDRNVLEGSRLRVSDIRWRDQRGFPLREPEWQIERIPSLIVDECPPRLRWAVKISSPGTLLGDLWGDTFYGQDLACALRRLGQDVVVDRTSSWERPGAGDDEDVTLTLRGLNRFTPRPGSVNLLWVISHPDRVTVDELRSGWDQVYSAGATWAAHHSARAGIAITPLLQATDPARFRPSEEELPRKGVLFVGRTRGERRPVVLDAAEVSDDLSVYGDDGWERYIDQRHIAGTVLPNAQLPRAYAEARVVLNDHWGDMRRGGFLSNRLFDAAATGARIVSDDVTGLTDVFGEQVRTYSTHAELQALLTPDSEAWPTEAQMRASAARVAAEHSFDARARVLLDDALRYRSKDAGR